MSSSSTPNVATVTTDPTEVSLGIRTYMTENTGFTAVSKARYSDFLVHEVNLHGEVAVLSNPGGPATKEPSAETKESNTQNNPDRKNITANRDDTAKEDAMLIDDGHSAEAKSIKEEINDKDAPGQEKLRVEEGADETKSFTDKEKVDKVVTEKQERVSAEQDADGIKTSTDKQDAGTTKTSTDEEMVDKEAARNEENATIGEDANVEKVSTVGEMVDSNKAGKEEEASTGKNTGETKPSDVEEMRSKDVAREEGKPSSDKDSDATKKVDDVEMVDKDEAEKEEKEPADKSMLDRDLLGKDMGVGEAKKEAKGSLESKKSDEKTLSADNDHDNGAHVSVDTSERTALDDNKETDKATLLGKRRREEETSESDSTEWKEITEKLTSLSNRTAKTDDVQGLVSDIISFVKAPANKEKKNFLILLKSKSGKEDRRQWHDTIRESLLTKTVAADTHRSDAGDYSIRLWNRGFQTEMPNFGKFDRLPRNKRPRKGQDLPPPDKQYLQFVLYKENVDTGAALNQLQRRWQSRQEGHRRGGGRKGRGHWNKREQRLRMGYAGMKDKRGVTSQFVTVPSSVSMSLLAQLTAGPLSSRGQADEDAGGGHRTRGSVSVVRVGNMKYVDEELRLGRLTGNRFDIVLRNIRPANQPKEDGGIMCKETLINQAKAAAGIFAKHGFINYYGLQRFGKYHDTHLTGISVLNKEYEKAVDIILSPQANATGERESIRQARELWKTRFSKMKTGASEADRSAAERKCADEMAAAFRGSSFMVSEISICQSLAKFPRDYARAYGSINKTMRMMFVHAVQSLIWNQMASERLQRSKTIIPGDLVLLRSSELSTTAKGEKPNSDIHVATEEDIKEGRYSLEQVVLPLVGSNSKIPEYCTKKDGKWIFSGGHEISLAALKSFKDRDFDLAGDYRHLLCRPEDVEFQVIGYSDPFQPLIQTDLMKINNQNVDFETKSAGKAPLLGMRIGFTLPSSSYATIALRELMKCPTSSEYQSDLGLGKGGKQ